MKEVYTVENAGLVILTPFLPHFLKRLGLIGEGGHFVDDKARAWGVRALARLGDMENALREEDLPLSKLLCGWRLTRDISSIEAARYLENVDFRYERLQLLQAVIHHWKGLEPLGADSFMHDFVLRPGTVVVAESRLLVPRQPQDALMSALPWSLGVIFLPWMERPLQVEW